MTRWSRLLGQSAAVPEDWLGRAVRVVVTRSSDSTERLVAASVERASGLLAGRPSCLACVTAAQIMLRCRRRAGVVVIGLRRPDDPSADWDTHAWLVGRSGALSGGNAAAGFTAASIFLVPSRLGLDEIAAPIWVPDDRAGSPPGT